MGDSFVSIIVVTLNNISLLRDCLSSLKSQTYKNIEIILVDNGSTEDVQSFVKTEFPEVVFIRLPTNQGFAGGNNVGIASAKGEYVALINNDAVADVGWVSAMVRAMAADKKIGSVAPIILDGNNEAVLDSVGLGVALDGMSRQNLKGEAPPNYKNPAEVLMVSGCACMFRSSALKDVGLFDPDFFAYCEDADLGLRLRFAGWKAVVAPGAMVLHRYSMTTGKFALKKVYFVERNHFWVVAKNFPLFLSPVVPFVTLWRYAVQSFLVLRGREGGLSGFVQNAGFGEITRVYFSACADMLRALPSMLGKRARQKPVRRIGALASLSLLLKHRLPMVKILGG